MLPPELSCHKRQEQRDEKDFVSPLIPERGTLGFDEKDLFFPVQHTLSTCPG